jgi:hypothetical protein
MMKAPSPPPTTCSMKSTSCSPHVSKQYRLFLGCSLGRSASGSRGQQSCGAAATAHCNAPVNHAMWWLLAGRRWSPGVWLGAVAIAEQVNGERAMLLPKDTSVLPPMVAVTPEAMYQHDRDA